jgi:hypothetical protein
MIKIRLDGRVAGSDLQWSEPAVFCPNTWIYFVSYGDVEIQFNDIGRLAS